MRRHLSMTLHTHLQASRLNYFKPEKYLKRRNHVFHRGGRTTSSMKPNLTAFLGKAVALAFENRATQRLGSNLRAATFQVFATTQALPPSCCAYPIERAGSSSVIYAAALSGSGHACPCSGLPSLDTPKKRWRPFGSYQTAKEAIFASVQSGFSYSALDGDTTGTGNSSRRRSSGYSNRTSSGVAKSPGDFFFFTVGRELVPRHFFMNYVVPFQSKRQQFVANEGPHGRLPLCRQEGSRLLSESLVNVTGSQKSRGIERIDQGMTQ